MFLPPPCTAASPSPSCAEAGCCWGLSRCIPRDCRRLSVAGTAGRRSASSKKDAVEDGDGAGIDAGPGRGARVCTGAVSAAASAEGLGLLLELLALGLV